MIKAAAAQIAPDLSSRSSTTNIVLDAMDEAHRNGANFIVFPETFIPGIKLNPGGVSLSRFSVIVALAL